MAPQMESLQHWTWIFPFVSGVLVGNWVKPAPKLLGIATDLPLGLVTLAVNLLKPHGTSAEYYTFNGWFRIRESPAKSENSGSRN